MDAKPDGTLYSRITRKTVAIISFIRTGRVFTLHEIAGEIHDKAISEFHLRRFNREMSISRIRDYVGFVRDIGAIEAQGNKYILTFQPRRLDGEWAQALSDLALVHLADLLGSSAQDIQARIERQLSLFFRARQLPTLTGLAQRLGIEGGREEERFRWSMSLYTDGETCPFTIHHYPVLLKRS